MAWPKIAGFSLPLIVAAVAAAIGGGVLVAILTGDGGGGGPAFITPTPTRTPGSAGTITAEGEIAYVTSDLRVGLTDPTGSASQVISDFDGVTAVFWSVDGSMLAADVGSNGGRVIVISPSGEELFEIAGATDPQWSPVDNRILAVGEGDVVLLDAAGAELTRIPDAVGPVWSPDGSLIAYLRIDDQGLGTPMIMDLATGGESDLAPSIEPGEPLYPIAWNPRGDRIAYRDSLYNLSTGEVERLEGVPVLWSPDGRLLLQTLGPEEGEGTNAWLFDYDQAGQRIIGLFVRESAEGIPPWLYVQRWLVWKPDGSALAYLDPQPLRPTLRYYDTLAPSQDRAPGIEGRDPDISPAGSHIAFSQREKLWVYALDGSALVHILDGIRPNWRPSQ